MFYILHGDEEFTRSEELAKLKAQMARSGMGDLNITVLDGRKVELAELINVCNTMPFLTDRRMVIVENLLQRFEPRERSEDASSTTASSPKESEYAAKLGAYLEQLPPFTRLIFVENKLLSRNNPILKKAQGRQDSHIREFSPLAAEALPDWVRSRATAKRISVARDAAQALVARVGPNLRLLDQELEKLAAYVNYARPVSVEDVRALVSEDHEGNIFALVDMLGLRQRERAMQQLQELLLGGANELYILTMIARQVRLILAAKDLAQTRRLKPEEIRRELRIAHGFVLDKLLRQAQQFSFEELVTVHRRVLEADQAIKTGRIEPRLALELLVLDICRRRARPQRRS